INTETTTDPKAWLEISHEALITGWPRFTDWVTAAQESLRYGSLITMLAQEWAQAGRRKEYLLSGNQLARAEFWLETADPSNLQRSFVETGTDFRKRNEKFQQVLQRFVFAFIGGSVAMILYAWINLAGPAILINEKIGRALSSGVLFGLSIALTVLVSDELPSQFLRQWKPWSRLVVSLLLGTTFGTLVWGSYQWMLLYLSVSEADFAALALGGLALTSGFALSRAFRVSSIPATVLTSLILFAAITFSYSNLSTPFIYFINSEVVVSQGLMIASVIAIGGHAQALWHDVRRMFPT
ncbi:MAG: hypothetical protein K8J31_21885, partial [Anaerolineae bacterium]|nr:hypothetical protein [Anaerolineae bacterium]